MFTRILVPLDGSAPTETVVTPVCQVICSDPSMASHLANGLEAQTQTQQNAISGGVPWEGIPLFSLLHENLNADALPAVADAMEVDTIAKFTPVPLYRAG